MKLHPVGPICSRPAVALVRRDGKCNLEAIDSPQYPESPRGEELREARLASSISMGDLARKLGIGPAELSGLEHGRFTTDAEGWAEAKRAIIDLTDDDEAWP
jgi:hypothetical protein